MTETQSPPAEAAHDPVARLKRIAIAAYLRAQNRHFAPGHEVADWLAAEAAVDSENGFGKAPDAPSSLDVPSAVAATPAPPPSAPSSVASKAPPAGTKAKKASKKRSLL